MLHLQDELSKRRDKRIELATRKRTFQVSNATKKRRLDEESTWSWWKVSFALLRCAREHSLITTHQLQRDELQTDMISEANRKRRRLERDRRAIERPQPSKQTPCYTFRIRTYEYTQSAEYQLSRMKPLSLLHCTRLFPAFRTASRRLLQNLTRKLSTQISSHSPLWTSMMILTTSWRTVSMVLTHIESTTLRILRARYMRLLMPTRTMIIGWLVHLTHIRQDQHIHKGQFRWLNHLHLVMLRILRPLDVHNM